MNGLARVADNVGLVQGAGVDHRLDPLFGEDFVDERAVGHRADHVGMRARRDIQADDVVPCPYQGGDEEAAEPAGRSGDEDTHGYIAAFRNATLSSSTGALPRKGLERAIATFSWESPG